MPPAGPANTTQRGTQLEFLRLLLIDQDAEPQDTMVEWIAQDVTDPERQALATLTPRLAHATGAQSLHAVSAP